MASAAAPVGLPAGSVVGVGSTRFWLPPPAASPLGTIALSGEVDDDEPHVPGPLRQMDDWVLSVVTAGRGWYREEDGPPQPLAAGMLTLIPPGLPHWYGTSVGQNWSELFLVFSGPLFDTMATAGVLRGRSPRRIGAGPALTLLRAVVRAEAADRGSLERRLFALAGWLSELHATDAAEDQVGQAARELAADLRGELDLHVLASRHGFSYDTFRRAFKARYGRPPGAYRTDARLAAATRLLQLTDLGLAEIAHRLGYADEFHFSRRFRDRYGEPPGRFRRR